MWIMTSYGILMPAALPTDLIVDDDLNMQVRARDRKALVKLRKRMIANGYTVGSIIATPKMDYEYRVYVNSSDFAEFIALEIEAIDYEKFKPTTLRKGGGGERLHSLYNRIWSVVATHYDSAILGRYERRMQSRQSWWKDPYG